MTDTTVSEVVPGITRIESVLGPRPFSQYLVDGGERSLLVDTGCASTPAEVILPALAGRTPTYVLVSHADVDHCGGNAAIREAAPAAIFMAHALDAAWIESREAILRERYGWYAAYGIAYDGATLQWLTDALGPDMPLDLHLCGGERLRLGPQLTVEILHVPGHSPGHLGVWEPRSRTAIVMDAVLGAGLLDLDGRVIHPPPIGDPGGYERSARLLQRLEPARLLTAHYDVIAGAAVDRFLDESLAFVARARRLVEDTLAEAPEIAMRELLARADEELGPFSSMPNELGATLRGLLLEAGVEPRA
jgi:glyoxylase-like metal-dependent hydrolase (beta-lactamase superfamily II)